MPETTVSLSQRESELIEEYAEQNGMSPEAAIKSLYRENILSRLRFRRTKGEVRTFRLPEKHRAELKR